LISPARTLQQHGSGRLRRDTDNRILFQHEPNKNKPNTMKSSKLIFTGILCSLGLALSAYGADTYKVDPVHSSVVFGIKHNGVTNFYGAFKEISGTVTFDAADATKSSVELTVPVESVDTRSEKRDQHLKSPDFFNAKQFPAITFKSNKVEGSGDSYKISGDLTIHGVTKPITVDFKRGADGKGGQGKTVGGGEARFTIKRSDYDMKFMIGPLDDDVNIILSLEGAKQ
jgi:polyisoprenoid-binding protein YceI